MLNYKKENPIRNKLDLIDHTLRDLLPLSLTSTPCVSIQKENKVWNGAVMLIHYLESFTDSLVVTDKNEPIGIVGGKDIIEGILKNPSSDFFDKKTIQEIMDTNPVQISKQTTLGELLNEWKKSRRAFSMIPNQYGGYSAVSARRILEIGINCKTEMMISELPKKAVVSFKKEDNVGTVINLMLEHGTRKLILEDSTKFISDRMIVEKIARDLDYLRNTDNFLELPASAFSLEDAKVQTENIQVQKVYKILFGMLHPYIIFKDQVISPWDLCMNLESGKLNL